MSDTQESSFFDRTQAAENVSNETEKHTYSSQQYTDMKDDPSMSYEYSSARPAAGHPTAYGPQNMDPAPSGRRHYKTAGDTTDDAAPLNMSPSHFHKPEVKSYSSQDYTDMKDDPLMSHVYTTERAAAGHPSSIFPHVPNKTEPAFTSRRHYKTADDNDTGNNISGASSPAMRTIDSIIHPIPLDLTTSGHFETKGVSYSSQEYADMKGNPTMSYEYSSGRQAAGYPSPHVPHNMGPTPTGRRHYQMASDVLGTGTDESGSSVPEPGSDE